MTFHFHHSEKRNRMNACPASRWTNKVEKIKKVLLLVGQTNGVRDSIIILINLGTR